MCVIGYYDSQAPQDGYTTTSYSSGRWQTETIPDFSHTYNGGGDTQTSAIDKDESEPLSYNSRPFNTTSSLRGLTDSRYEAQCKCVDAKRMNASCLSCSDMFTINVCVCHFPFICLLLRVFLRIDSFRFNCSEKTKLRTSTYNVSVR